MDTTAIIHITPDNWPVAVGLVATIIVIRVLLSQGRRYDTKVQTAQYRPALPCQGLLPLPRRRIRAPLQETLHLQPLSALLLPCRGHEMTLGVKFDSA